MWLPGLAIRFRNAADAPSDISVSSRWAFARCAKAARSWLQCGKAWSYRKRCMAPKFPRLIVLLFRLRFLRSAEFALGDLIEESNAGTGSRRWLWLQAFSLLWLGTRRSTIAYQQRENTI